MAFLFLDTSALVKRYVAEKGSAWVQGLTGAVGNRCWIASVTRVEVVAALHRRVRTRMLTLAQVLPMEAVFLSELGTRFRSIPPGAVVLNNAMRLVAAHPLRAYDAVQLAAALYLRSKNAALGLAAPLFLSADQNLTHAAAAEGLSTDDPNLHP